MNINKYIAQSGLTSRRGADRLVKESRVKINGKIAKLIDKVSEKDIIFVDDKPIKLATNKVYLVFNKPVGIITTTDPASPNNIIDYIKHPVRIFPVGRLDVKSQGLIILTNDGDIVNEILKGKNKVEKEYVVNVDKDLNEVFLDKLRRGVVLDGFKTLPTKVEKINDRQFSIVLVEGKNRQIRRMCMLFRYNVTKLVRIRIGNISIDDIKSGKYVEFSKEKIKQLLNLK